MQFSKLHSSSVQQVSSQLHSQHLHSSSVQQSFSQLHSFSSHVHGLDSLQPHVQELLQLQIFSSIIYHLSFTKYIIYFNLIFCKCIFFLNAYYVVVIYVYSYNNININYKDYGNKKERAIVFLHGWGQNIEMMDVLAKHFSKTNRVVIIDLPGFGKSLEPLSVWSLNDYALMVNSLVKYLDIDDPIIVGHSFGGKIGIVYASLYKVYKLVLFASPFRVVKKKLTFKQKFLKFLIKLPNFKFIKNWLKKHIGSNDYKNASCMMRDILVKHVNTDVSSLAFNISIPTLIVWGSNDLDVPYTDGVLLNRLIKNSSLVTFFNSGHYAYLENLSKTINIMKKFFDR